VRLGSSNGTGGKREVEWKSQNWGKGIKKRERRKKEQSVRESRSTHASTRNGEKEKRRGGGGDKKKKIWKGKVGGKLWA